MQTRDINQWETSISQVVSSQDEEDIVVRGRSLNELIGQITFTDVMFLMLQGRLPTVLNVMCSTLFWSLASSMVLLHPP